MLLALLAEGSSGLSGTVAVILGGLGGLCGAGAAVYTAISSGSANKAEVGVKRDTVDLARFEAFTRQVKEFSDQLSEDNRELRKECEDCQQEVVALKQKHNHDLAELKSQHRKEKDELRTEIRRLEQRINELTKEPQ